MYGYNTSFKFDEFGYGTAMLLTVALVVLALAALSVRLIRREAAE
jgi:multiple sugar transport system permease protein